MAKRALCVGINNYPGSQNDLQGCVNDMNDWAEMFRAHGFDEVVTLQDSQASKSALMKELEKGITETGIKDLFFFTFSGHGTWVPDDDGDEADGRDEALCPWDFSKNVIIDDELFDLFSTRHYGSRIVMFSDSCHSGSVARMGPALGTSRRKIRFMPPGIFLSAKHTAVAKRLEKAASKGKMRSTCLLVSGCKDTEYSYDAWFGARANGAFTYAALEALKNLGTTPGGAETLSDYRDWYKAIRKILPSISHPQTPQFTATSSQRKWKILED